MPDTPQYEDQDCTNYEMSKKKKIKIFVGKNLFIITWAQKLIPFLYVNTKYFLHSFIKDHIEGTKKIKQNM